MIPVHQQSASRCFVYGTLMSREVLQTLLGRVPEMDPRPAFLPPAYSRHPVLGEVFPGVVASNEESSTTTRHRERVEGILLSGVTPEEVEIFDWFEDAAYERISVPVCLCPDTAPTTRGNGHADAGDAVARGRETVDADVYLWTAGEEHLDLESPWDFEQFCARDLGWYLRSSVRPCKEEYDRR